MSRKQDIYNTPILQFTIKDFSYRSILKVIYEACEEQHGHIISLVAKNKNEGVILTLNAYVNSIPANIQEVILKALHSSGITRYINVKLLLNSFPSTEEDQRVEAVLEKAYIDFMEELSK